MAGLNLRGDTSGSVEIVSPAVAGDNTITLPKNNGGANQFFKNSTTAGIVTHSSMVEDASGNIGIGTITPTETLHVVGDARVTGILTVGTSSLTLNGDSSTISGITTINSVSFPSAGALSNRNLIINGAMQVAQRGISSTTSGYNTVDRFTNQYGGTDENITWERATPDSSSTPYSLGFGFSLKATNGNQTSGAGAADFCGIGHRIEAINVANSGWNYTSSSSYITLTFWVKSSVQKSFVAYLKTFDGTEQIYPFNTGTLAADTWTKVTKTIPGNSNIQIDRDHGPGLELFIYQFLGTDYTNNSVTENAWAAYASGTRTPDDDSSWFTTNDATFELTGVQLEVGTQPTPFEHRSYADDLFQCQRYYQRIQAGRVNAPTIGYAESTQVVVNIPLHQTPRVPLAHDISGRGTLTKVGAIAVNAFASSTDNVTGINFFSSIGNGLSLGLLTSGSYTAGDAEIIRYGATGDQVIFTLDTEL